MLRSAKGRQLAAAMPPDRVHPETDGSFTEVDGTTLKPWQAWNCCFMLVDAAWEVRWT